MIGGGGQLAAEKVMKGDEVVVLARLGEHAQIKMRPHTILEVDDHKGVVKNVWS